MENINFCAVLFIVRHINIQFATFPGKMFIEQNNLNQTHTLF